MGETKQRRPGIKHDVEFIRGGVSTACQRPRPTKHKDLLLYCYSTVKASLAHPRVPGGVTRGGGNRRSNQRGFVILTPYILCSNCCCHQFNYVGLQTATLSCNRHSPCHDFHTFTRQTLPPEASAPPPPPPGLLHQPFHLFLEVQKLFVDTQEDRSMLSTSFYSSRVSLIQASTLRGSRHATNPP